MDDFGNDYQTTDWWMFNTQYIYSMSVHGMMDEIAINLCFFAAMRSGFDYPQAEI